MLAADDADHGDDAAYDASGRPLLAADDGNDGDDADYDASGRPFAGR